MNQFPNGKTMLLIVGIIVVISMVFYTVDVSSKNDYFELKDRVQTFEKQVLNVIEKNLDEQSKYKQMEKHSNATSEHLAILLTRLNGLENQLLELKQNFSDTKQSTVTPSSPSNQHQPSQQQQQHGTWPWTEQARNISALIYIASETRVYGWPEQYDPTAHRAPDENCGPNCKFTEDRSLRNGCDVFLEDPDSSSCAKTKPQANTKAASLVLEALDFEKLEKQRPNCPENAKLDYILSFHTEPSNKIIPCGTLYDANDIVSQAQAALKEKPQSARENAIGFVSRNSREFRNEMATKLSAYLPLRSYGSVMNNALWPDGRSGDKLHAFKRHRFCLAIENHLDDPEYITEKLWDCYKTASIPIYYGNIGRAVLPKHSYVNITAFSSIEKVGEFIRDMTLEDAQSYLEWVNNPPSEFLDFWKTRSYKSILCRLCERVQLDKYLNNW